MSLKISLIGTGNVATQLAIVLTENHYHLHQVVGRDFAKTQTFASNFNAEAVSYIEQLSDVDLVIIAVNDQEIEKVSLQLNPIFKVAHTSGTVGIEALRHQEQSGVFYPLQTFKKEQKVDWQNIPILVESENKEFEALLKLVANSVSNKVYTIDSKQRKKLHLSAVFACNFTNHLLGISKELCDQNEVPFDLLHPLIEETMRKCLKQSGFKHQTGPAVRNDLDIINEHQNTLLANPNWLAIYKSVTSSIQNTSDE